MKKSLILSLFFGILFLFIIFISEFVSGATVNALSCSLEDVQKAIDNANNGDIVNVPAGNCVWPAGRKFVDSGFYVYPSLGLNKSIILIGAGAGKTNITCAHTGYLIIYRPVNLSANNPFRVSGFTFDLNNNCSGIKTVASHSSDLTVQTKIRIDNNVFLHNIKQVFWNNGMRGVFDSNVIYNAGYAIRNPSSYRNGKGWWDNWDGIIFGTSNNNMYFEDNVITGVNSILMDCQYANRYALRYNTISVNKGAYPFLDMHGNQGTDLMYACFGGEVYGNVINMKEGQILDQRAGKVVLHNNVIEGATGSVWAVKVREEVWDEYNPTTNSQSQHVSDSYYWNNRKDYSGNLLISYLSENLCANSVSCSELTCPEKICSEELHGYSINENDEWYRDKAYFDGTSGIGCGALSNRPLTCTPSVGYWATNQSCTDLVGIVGVNPITPIQGTLYRCVSTNNWVAYYTPYIYPHPLRVASFGTDICDEGEITNECWCEGLKSIGYCYNGYYYSEEGERIITPPGEEEQPPLGEVVTIQNMLNAYQRYKRNEVSILYFLDKLRNWIIFR